MFDTETSMRSKKTQQANALSLSTPRRMLMMSRGMAYSRYLEDPCAAACCRQLRYDNTLFKACQAFFKDFLNFFGKIFYSAKRAWKYTYSI